MTVVLRVDCAPNPDALTRVLTSEFLNAWGCESDTLHIKHRDLGQAPVPHVSRAFVEALGTPREQHTPEMREATAYAKGLTEEFLSADRYVLSMPMRILNVPSQFKAYVEHIFHEGAVFRVGPGGYEGLLGGRKVVCITARGGDYRRGSPIERFDVLEPYIRGVFEFGGVSPADISVINVHATFGPPEVREATVAQARRELAELAARW
jgi:FMN-dependent NADH-azoreductase